MRYASILRTIKKIIQYWDPPTISWEGDYANWSEAKNSCLGYSTDEIIQKTFEATKEVIEGKALFSRDGVSFNTPEYNWPLIATIQRIYLNLGRKIQVIDFGGSFGDTFLQNRILLDEFISEWVVVEQKPMLLKAKELPKVPKLFFREIEQIQNKGLDLILLSSVIQYIEDFNNVIKVLKDLGPKGIFLDRTCFVPESRKTIRITKQTIRPPIYNATYPCQFFVKINLIEQFSPFVLLYEWNPLDIANIPSHYLGMYFERTSSSLNPI